jgi:hypothetical protein
MRDDTNKKEFANYTIHSKIVFLVWDRQSIRASGIAKRIGASLHLLFTSPIKHPLLYLKTLRILRNERPDVIICQSPPITCALMAIVYKYAFSRTKKPKILIDAHTGAIVTPWCKYVSRLVMSLASCNIVTNKELQDYVVQKYGLKTVILEDPIPDFRGILSTRGTHKTYNILQKDVFNIAVISSFAYDEPIEAVLDAASQLPDMRFYITGDKTKLDRKFVNQKLQNVTMTGLLEYDVYLDLLQKVDTIIDLTTDDKTMLSGAYEAVALEQPLIISDWMPLRRYFNKGTIYVNNSPKDIIDAVMVARSKKKELSTEMRSLRLEKTKEWDDKISTFYYLFT